MSIYALALAIALTVGFRCPDDVRTNASPGGYRDGVRACLMHSVNMAGPHRVRRVLRDLHRHPLAFVAALVLELQRTLDVLGNLVGCEVARDVLASRAPGEQP